jgi:hypothetical protein
MWRAQSQKRRKMIALMNKNMKGGYSLKLTSSLLSVLMLYFASVTELLVTETNRHCHQYLDRPDQTPTPLPLTTNSEMFLFIAIIVQMGHAICDRLRDYCTRTEKFITHFCPNTMVRTNMLYKGQVI